MAVTTEEILRERITSGKLLEGPEQATPAYNC